jgi:hypothetical protein
MIYGIQTCPSRRLTEISRALGDKVSVKTNMERLSRQVRRLGIWREETIGFLKQSYRLEDIRVLSYARWQNMMAVPVAVASFTAVYLGLRLKHRILMRYVLMAAPRIFGVASVPCFS